MITLSSTTGHAIRALACLSMCPNPPVNIKDIAECAQVPQAYLAKIIKKLNDAGIVESKRGSQGGVWLALPAKLISLLDISEAMEGENLFCTCLLGEAQCSDERDCTVHQFWVKNRESIRRELEKTKLSDVVEFFNERGIHQVSHD